MSKKLSASACLIVGSAGFGWLGACQSSPSQAVATDAGADQTSPGDGGGTSDSAGDGSPGLLIDNMTAPKGTQISLQIPDGGGTPGSYYTYSDYPVGAMNNQTSLTIGDKQLVDTPVMPPLAEPGGEQIVGQICFGGGSDGSQPGTVVGYAGLGMNLLYGTPVDAGPEAGACPPPGLSPPIPFEAGSYSGISFYLWVDPSDGGTFSVHFGVPDMQTGDPCAVPAVACASSDGGCFDDFGSDVKFTPGQWTKVSFKWAELSQQGFGEVFSAIEKNQILGMKWQVNGPGVTAPAPVPFRFCVSDIYLTP